MSNAIFHPAFAVLAVAVPISVFWITFTVLFDEGEDFQNYSNEIQVAGSELAFGDSKSEATVAVLGTITNTSPVPWKDVHFHADFFDAQGKRVDVGQKEVFSFYLPANASTSFKVSFRRKFPVTNYVSHTVRIITAKDARAKW
ncbi:MAG: FxLYD domain-containing protein [Verrucomicrobiota bacterium]